MGNMGNNILVGGLTITARCKEKIFQQIDAMYGGPSYNPEEPEEQKIKNTRRYSNAKQTHLLY